MKCPKCHRNTYSAKWAECSAEGCSLNKATGFAVTKLTPNSVTPTTEPSRPLAVTLPCVARVQWWISQSAGEDLQRERRH